MKKTIVAASFLVLILFLSACRNYLKDIPVSPIDKSVYRVPAQNPNLAGDPEAGLNYLIYGDYIGAGIPYELFTKVFKERKDTVLNRTGDNGKVLYMNNVFTTANGTKVVSGNCFSCHAGKHNGKVILGLGDSFGEFRKDLSLEMKLLNWKVKQKYGKKSPEWESFKEMGGYLKAIAPRIVMANPGSNPATRLAEACFAQRNPEDLTYRKEPYYEIMDFNVATDVPALWHLKKKKALYYNGMGRGDFSKLLLQAAVLGIHDSTAAREAQKKFQDVVAWAASLEPPAYPEPIDQELAAKGKELFTQSCKKCHGTYGKYETYPNKLVPLKEIGTDSLYAQAFYDNTGGPEWYNKSWFANSNPRSYFQLSHAYIAPPLDGVWVTAPYLHNGSVPTLEDLLNSSQRPKYWSRSRNSKDYDYEKVGWKYERRDNAKGKNTFNTTLPSYGNYGHTFGDELHDSERKALIEYLKTL